MQAKFFGADWFSNLATIVALLVAALVLYPLGMMVWDVFVGGDVSVGATIKAALASGILPVLRDTVWIIGLSILAATIIGGFLAWLSERTDIGMQGLTRFLPMVPLFVPPIAGAIGWVLLAAPRSGFLNRWIQDLCAFIGTDTGGPVLNIFSATGLIFVFSIYLIPNTFMTISSHLRNLDPALEESARMSGASVFRTLIHVTIPSVWPAAVAGMLLCLIMGLSLFSLPAVIGGPAKIELLSVRIVHLMISSYPPQTNTALILAMLVAIVIGLASWMQVRILRSGNFATIGGRGIGATRIPLGIYRLPARMLFLGFILCSTLLPFLALLIVSFQPFWSSTINWSKLSLVNYQTTLFASGTAHQAVLNSIWLGAVGATIGVALAALIAFFLTRHKNSRLASSIDIITKLPGAVSHLVVAIAFVIAFSGPPLMLYGTTTILLLAYVVLYIPQATLSATTAMHQVGSQLTEASLMAGASPGQTFLKISLPLMLPGLLAGWTLLFVLMSGDITASAMLAGNRNPVVGFVILDLWSGGSFPQLAAIGTIMTVLCSAVVLLATILPAKFAKR